jgi:hypothetical protein
VQVLCIVGIIGGECRSVRERYQFWCQCVSHTEAHTTCADFLLSLADVLSSGTHADTQKHTRNLC